jgi:putative hydrolase of the HAD superfamily
VLKGVLIDWGGVLTTRLSDAIADWLAADRIDATHYRDVMRELVLHAYEGTGLAQSGTDAAQRSGSPQSGTEAAWRGSGLAGSGGENPIHALERGEISAAEFERGLAARLLTLDGVAPAAEGLITRMFAAFRPVEEMHDMLRQIRAAGVTTCLLSNSWGNVYPRATWDGLFDEIVISGEVGMRKPEPRIFQHALDLVGLSAEQCVFIDDIQANIQAARALGILGIHHMDTLTTIAEIERLFSLPLRA